MMSLAALVGMDRNTGHFLTGLAHVRQSILDILTTTPGTRVCNREYGSDCPNLVDAPINPESVQRLYAASALAIARFYPQLTLTRIAISTDPSSPSTLTIDLIGHETGGDPQSAFRTSVGLPLVQALN